MYEIRRLGSIAALMLTLILAVGCGAPAITETDGAFSTQQDMARSAPAMDERQAAPMSSASPEVLGETGSLRDTELRSRANSILATFEYSTTDWDSTYGRAQNISDGRGITAGPVGFTTGTGDVLEFVLRLNEASPANPLAEYLDALKAVNESDSTQGLDGFIAAWQQADNDPVLRPLFRQVQDDVIRDWYFEPAMQRAEELGITTPLGQLILFDAEVQHGGGEDPDGTPAMIDEVNRTKGAVTSLGEVEWLKAFLAIRVEHLTNAADAATRDKWAESTPRCAALDKLLNDGRSQLQLPLHWESYGHEPFSITA